jgi:TolB-like protein
MDVRFGQYFLKRQERRLIGPAGPIELSARSFDILAALLDKPNEVIGKAELFDLAWPGLVVEENTLQVHISALRKALDSEMIATVHGRGYKYAGPMPESAPNAEQSLGFERKPAIVVLPFDNLSGDPGQQYFSDGITADITDRLTRFRIFAVIGQNSAAAFRGPTPDIAAVRARLKADFVVTGSLRRAGARIRISARLSDAASEEAIWAERYDRPLADLFELQDEISELVAAAIARQIEVEINVRSAVKPHASLSSYELMLQGYWHFKKLTRAGSQAARECFERATALDPRNAEAMSWLGVTYCECWVQDFSQANAVRGAELTGQAMALDPTSARSHSRHAWALLCNNDLDGAIKSGARGFALNPGDPTVLVNYALALTYEGRYADARALLAQARRLEPVPPLWFAEFEGVLAFAEGRYEECLAGVEPVPEVGWDMMYALACHGLLGNHRKAAEVQERLRQQGISVDFLYGAGFEPFREIGVRERLYAGLRAALSL